MSSKACWSRQEAVRIAGKRPSAWKREAPEYGGSGVASYFTTQPIAMAMAIITMATRRGKASWRLKRLIQVTC